MIFVISCLVSSPEIHNCTFSDGMIAFLHGRHIHGKQHEGLLLKEFHWTLTKTWEQLAKLAAKLADFKRFLGIC